MQKAYQNLISLESRVVWFGHPKNTFMLHMQSKETFGPLYRWLFHWKVLPPNFVIFSQPADGCKRGKWIFPRNFLIIQMSHNRQTEEKTGGMSSEGSLAKWNIKKLWWLMSDWKGSFIVFNLFIDLNSKK